MEQLVIKLLPIAIWLGFFLRLYKHNIDKDFPFNTNTELGRTNINSAVFSGIVTLILFVLVWIIKADDNIDTSTITGVLSLFGWFGMYFAIGWTPDSILQWIISKGQASMHMTIDKSNVGFKTDNT